MTNEQDAQKSTPLVLRKEAPAILAAYSILKRGNQQLHTRLLQYSRTEPTLDIREFVRTPEASYFTRKGVALTLDQLYIMRDEVIPNAIKAMEAMKGGINA